MPSFLHHRIGVGSPQDTYSTDDPLLSAPVSLERQTLWFGTVELYDDTLTVSGWQWTGPVKWVIALDEMRLVERWTVLKGPNFVFHTDEGALHCRVEGAAWDLEQALKKDRAVTLKMRS